VIKFIVARASHAVIPSYYSLAVAQAAYEIGFREAAATIIEPTNESRRVLGAFLADIIGKGYYAFINVGQWLKAKGWKDSEPFGQYLAEEHGLAVVPGAYFSEYGGLAVVPGAYFSEYGGDWIRFSYATPPDRTLGAAERLVEGLGAL